MLLSYSFRCLTENMSIRTALFDIWLYIILNLQYVRREKIAPGNFVDGLVPPCNLPNHLFPFSPLALSIHLDLPALLVPHSSSVLPALLTPSSSPAPPRAPSPPARLCEVYPLATPQPSRPMSPHLPVNPSSLPWLCALSAPAWSTITRAPLGSLVTRHPCFTEDFRASGCTSALHPFSSTFSLASLLSSVPPESPQSPPRMLKPATSPWTSWLVMSPQAIILLVPLGFSPGQWDLCSMSLCFHSCVCVSGISFQLSSRFPLVSCLSY